MDTEQKGQGDEPDEPLREEEVAVGDNLDDNVAEGEAGLADDDDKGGDAS